MFTHEDALRGLRMAVQARGKDFVYPDNWRGGDGLCQYVLSDDTPACIVGMALDELGYDVAGMINCGISEALENLGIDYTRTAHRVLSNAQNIQDYGGTWGHALEAAERVI